MYALDMSNGKQDVLGNRNRLKKPLMMGVIVCYKFVVDKKTYKHLILLVFRTLFIFQAPQDIVV
jgi:hypothetical protein